MQISPDQIANPPNCVTLEEPLPVSLSVSDISVREDFTAIAKLGQFNVACTSQCSDYVLVSFEM